MSPEQEYFISIWELIIKAVSGIAIPGVIAYFANRYTKLREAEENIREERINLYRKIIDPFQKIFLTQEILSKDNNNLADDLTGVDLAIKKILTVDYKDTAFQFSLIASDNVMIAYNDLMQSFYNQDENSDEQGSDLIGKIANLLLEIRKSVGNENTNLQAPQMLEWTIRDIRKYMKNGKYPKKLKIPTG